MKTRFAATALILASGLIASIPTFADELYGNRYPEAQVPSSVTREQVKAELADAVRTGDIIAGAEGGLKLNELYPNRYPARQVQAGVTREQVKAELADAIRTGDIMAGGESDQKLNELHPNRYLTKHM